MEWMKAIGDAVDYIETHITEDIDTRIFSEWLPALKEYEFAAGYCIEMYDHPDKYPKGTADESYRSEIWIPIAKK